MEGREPRNHPLHAPFYGSVANKSRLARAAKAHYGHPAARESCHGHGSNPKKYTCTPYSVAPREEPSAGQTLHSDDDNCEAAI